MIKTTDKYIFFYTEWPSNFCHTHFEYEAFGEKHVFFCTEQAFMWAKATYFNDLDTARAILSEDDDPMTCKYLGRMVQNYDDKKWDAVRYQFMFDVNLCRFSQDEKLKAKILDKSFEGKTFVEASPYDKIWGIGHGMTDPKLEDDSHWGRNLLGKALTEVRETLVKGV